MANLVGETNDPNLAAVKGSHTGAGDGVQGFSKDLNHLGVLGVNTLGPGVKGQSDSNDGVQGFSSHQNRHGVVGTNTAGGGMLGQSTEGSGVVGLSQQGHGVHGRGPTGGFFEGGSGAGVHAVALATGPAGRFEGDVQVTGDVSLTGGDCAEEFDVVETEIVESGTVMVLGEEGELRPSYKAYDKRVAGVISGAGDYKPGIVLDKQPSQRKRQPIALLGKVYCKVDAGYAPIEIGDLLTTSPTQGHAMKATDPLKAFGTVIGKALRPVREAQNLIPILIALQ